MDSSGNVVGTVGKDSGGNLLVTGGNGSNFNQTPQFTTTISGNTVTTTNGSVTAQMTLTPSGNDAASGSGGQMTPAHTGLMVVGPSRFVSAVNAVEAKSAGIGMKNGDGSIFDELRRGDQNVVIKPDSWDHVKLEDDDSTLDVFWNPKSGIYVRTSTVGPGSSLSNYQSPALGLIHELGHAYQYSVEHKVNNGDNPLEEGEIINGVELKWATKYYEPVRIDHGGVEREDTALFDHTEWHH